MSSWCDKLASTPGAGFKMSSQHFLINSELLRSLTPLLDRNVDAKGPAFTIEAATEFSINVKTNSGLIYGADPERVHVSFQHMMRPKAISGQPPIMEMLSTPQPFTRLLPNVVNELIETTLMLPNSKDRAVERLGVISTTQVSEDELPPGVLKMIKYFGAPWGAVALPSYSIQITSPLGSTASYNDRCVHSARKSDRDDELVTIQLDYQRTYKDKRKIEKNILSADMEKLSGDALKYFESVAVGDMFDGR